MKTSFFIKEVKNKSEKQTDERKLNLYLKSLIIVFILSTLFLTYLYSNLSTVINEKIDNSNDYVSVFKESNLHDILFTEVNYE